MSLVPSTSVLATGCSTTTSTPKFSTPRSTSSKEDTASFSRPNLIDATLKPTYQWTTPVTLNAETRTYTTFESLLEPAHSPMARLSPSHLNDPTALRWHSQLLLLPLDEDKDQPSQRKTGTSIRLLSSLLLRLGHQDTEATTRLALV